MANRAASYRKSTRRITFIGMMGVVVAISACAPKPPRSIDEPTPQRLSQWRLFALSELNLTPAAGLEVVRPANPLFTDYAHKLRTVWLTEGSQARLVDGEINYPIGTILSKTFYYPTDQQGNVVKRPDANLQTIALDQSRLIETRLLVRRSDGWQALPYVWNEEQSEAFLRPAGTAVKLTFADPAKEGSKPLAFSYFVPNQNQCSGCHTTDHPDGGLRPLGAVAQQLTVPAVDGGGVVRRQVDTLVSRGWLDRAPLGNAISYLDESAGLSERAIAYLNMQCGHCHNPQGAADTSGLMLSGGATSGTALGICKPPVAAGGGTGNLHYGIVPGDPSRSILHFRMASTQPDEMMPELGRSLVHEEGVALIRDWIAALPGSCGAL